MAKLDALYEFIQSDADEDELLAIHDQVRERIIRLRTIRANAVAGTLTVGDYVEWNSSRGDHVERLRGELIKINRKTVKVYQSHGDGGGTTWTVPLSLIRKEEPVVLIKAALKCPQGGGGGGGGGAAN